MTPSRHLISISATRGFTLVELVVVLVIISILASLSLAGMGSLRQRAKIDKTTSTIRKLHEIVWPLVGGIYTRRLAAPSTMTYFSPPAGIASNPKRWEAWRRRELIRRQQIMEMPETWNEVADINPATGGYVLPVPVCAALTEPPNTPFDLVTGSLNFNAPVRAFTARKNAVSSHPRRDDYASAECLFMIVGFSGEPGILETFHASEIGDKDGDGAPEFHDAWGKPILFMRWAPGISYSQIQQADPSTNPDLTDPMRLDPSEHGLIPLIWSGGADDSLSDWNPTDPGYGFQATNAGWLAALMSASNGSPSSLYSICTSTNGQSLTPNAAHNITNHALPLR